MELQSTYVDYKAIRVANIFHFHRENSIIDSMVSNKFVIVDFS